MVLKDSRLISVVTTLTFLWCNSTAAQEGSGSLKILRVPTSSSVELLTQDGAKVLKEGDRVGPWTLMAVIPPAGREKPFAILEDFTHPTGHLLVVDQRGVRIDLPKSLEATWPDPAKLYLGHTLREVIDSPSDLLGDEILWRPGDPSYDEIASVFPPIRSMSTYSFVGTNRTTDKVGFTYGGRSPDFDPAPYYVPIARIREEGKVQDGLVGGYLPILRFVYPESAENWTEMIAFAPLRFSNDNDRIQPVWYRVVHIEGGAVKWVHYIDSYHPFPPRTNYDPAQFYGDLVKLHDGWQELLKPAMKIAVPDKRVENMARFALVRDLMTRVGAFPKYGAVDKDYAGSEHDGFPDTFNVDTAAMLEWGMLEQAGRFIDNYLGKFVRDDGSLLYRGPEVGQYGRMLTVLAQYSNYGGDAELLVQYRSRIDGVTKLLLYLRDKAKELPPGNPAYGMISGWSEADACLDANPSRYMQPYFSNSTEAARGFRDMGQVWKRIGEQKKNSELMAWGEHLIRESEELQRDLQNAISRSVLKEDGKTILPSIAGVQEPFHVAVPRDPTDPQFRSYRAYVEMMHSGLLNREQVGWIVNYRATHHDTILGVPTAYGYKTGALAGFLAYGHGYGLIQHDDARRALLLFYSLMAHQYTRGTWTAPETRPVFDASPAAPYCTPAQLVVALLTRWILVFEDPTSEMLWLGKAAPRKWLEDGQNISVSDAPTRWGKISWSTESHLAQNNIATTLVLPPGHFAAAIQIRLRAPSGRQIRSVLVNGKRWSDFDATAETVALPGGLSGTVKIVAQY